MRSVFEYVPKVQALSRLRLRHIHIPDRPPYYTPRSFPGNVRDHIETLILNQRERRRVNHSVRMSQARQYRDSSDDPFLLRTWLDDASPPPTVLSFTRRPTYVLPKHFMATAESWEAQFLTKNLRAKMSVNFPQPPNWSSRPWRSEWELKMGEKQWESDPLSHEWTDTGVLTMPCQEPMYFGPGQLTIWPIIDTGDIVQVPKKIATKWQLERMLENTTIRVLKREYGIDAFAIIDSPGVWVHSSIAPKELTEFPEFGFSADSSATSVRNAGARRIATVHADIVEGITRHGISIHVGVPGPIPDQWTSSTNPWVLLRQQDKTTSIVAELAQKGWCPQQSDPERMNQPTTERKSEHLMTLFDESYPHSGHVLKSMPYEMVLTGDGQRSPAPMGMDNHHLSTVWAYEFARQLNMGRGLIEHYGKVIHRSTGNDDKLPEPAIAFKIQAVEHEDSVRQPYEQVQLPSSELHKVLGIDVKLKNNFEIQDSGLHLEGATTDRWPVSWPSFFKNLQKHLTESVAGRSLDTRWRDFLWREGHKAEMQQRKQLLRDARDIQKQWDSDPVGLAAQRLLVESVVGKLKKTIAETINDLREVSIDDPHKQKLLQGIEKAKEVLYSRSLRKPSTNPSVHDAITQPVSSDNYDPLTTFTMRSREGALIRRVQTQPEEQNVSAKVRKVPS